eukprot:363477-Chlamydomonas_euryale.AAC.2
MPLDQPAYPQTKLPTAALRHADFPCNPCDCPVLQARASPPPPASGCDGASAYLLASFSVGGGGDPAGASTPACGTSNGLVASIPACGGSGGPPDALSGLGLTRVVVASTCGLTTLDTRLEVLRGGGGGGGTAITQSNDACGLQSAVAFFAPPGEAFEVRSTHGWKCSASAAAAVTAAPPSHRAMTCEACSRPSRSLRRRERRWRRVCARLHVFASVVVCDGVRERRGWRAMPFSTCF